MYILQQKCLKKYSLHSINNISFSTYSNVHNLNIEWYNVTIHTVFLVGYRSLIIKCQPHGYLPLHKLHDAGQLICV